MREEGTDAPSSRMCLILQFALNPFAGIDKRLNPWSNLLLAAFTWIPCLLPGEDRTLQVGHHGKVTTVCRADTCYIIVRAVRVTRIFSVVVFCDDIVLVFCLREVEPALAVCHPDAEFVAAQRTEHHTVVLRNGQIQERAFKLLAGVVAEVGTVLVLRVDEIQFHHQLTAVADTQ